MKRAALLLNCLLCLSLFAGCSGETEKVGPASDPLGYLEKGILTMSESELLKLEDDFEKEVEDDGGISYIRQFESGEYSGVFSVSYEQGKVKSLFYTIGFEENEGGRLHRILKIYWEICESGMERKLEDSVTMERIWSIFKYLRKRSIACVRIKPPICTQSSGLMERLDSMAKR